jgi:hypothetical protein
MMLKRLPNKILNLCLVLVTTNASEMIAAYTLSIGGAALRCKAGPKNSLILNLALEHNKQ